MGIDADVSGAALDWSTPSPRLRVLRRYEVLATTVGALAVALAIAIALDATTAAVVAAVGVIVAGVIADGIAGRRVRAWGYTERAEDLLVRRGVMFRRTSVIPYGRMQYVEVTAGPFERSFGLATVQMHTAAAASDARIPGLPAREAARLRDQLTSLGESHAMGL
ncbi:MAG TPA: PH domain-containing protein [Solirubrobacteraceae bacterium]|jgi:membrane protein YdbS with pleckstrin-like domain|nr:PH domain-containing protein [Solirubrobacteraceae bacterium]